MDQVRDTIDACVDAVLHGPGPAESRLIQEAQHLYLIGDDATWGEAYSALETAGHVAGLSAETVTRAIEMGKSLAYDQKLPVKLWNWAETEPRPTEWLIGGVIPRESCLVCGAEEKTGKTWLGLGVALALATRGRLLDTWEAKERATTLLISPEGSRSGMKRRLFGLCWSLGIDPKEVAAMTPVWPGRLSLAADDDMEKLRRTLEIIKPALLLLDPLVTATDGAEENDSGAMQAHLNRLRDLIGVVPGMSLLLTHHLAKGSRDGRSPWHALRGSSALGAWADGLITLRRADESSSSVRRIDVWHRDDPSPEPRGFRLEVGASEVPGVPTIRLAPCAAPEMGGGSKKKSSDQLLTDVRRAPGKWTLQAWARYRECSDWSAKKAIEPILGVLVERRPPDGRLWPKE